MATQNDWKFDSPNWSEDSFEKEKREENASPLQPNDRDSQRTTISGSQETSPEGPKTSPEGPKTSPEGPKTSPEGEKTVVFTSRQRPSVEKSEDKSPEPKKPKKTEPSSCRKKTHPLEETRGDEGPEPKKSKLGAVEDEDEDSPVKKKVPTRKTFQQMIEDVKSLESLEMHPGTLKACAVRGKNVLSPVSFSGMLMKRADQRSGLRFSVGKFYDDVVGTLLDHQAFVKTTDQVFAKTFTCLAEFVLTFLVDKNDIMSQVAPHPYCDHTSRQTEHAEEILKLALDNPRYTDEEKKTIEEQANALIVSINAKLPVVSWEGEPGFDFNSNQDNISSLPNVTWPKEWMGSNVPSSVKVEKPKDVCNWLFLQLSDLEHLRKKSKGLFEEFMHAACFQAAQHHELVLAANNKELPGADIGVNPTLSNEKVSHFLESKADVICAKKAGLIQSAAKYSSTVPKAIRAVKDLMPEKRKEAFTDMIMQSSTDAYADRPKHAILVMTYLLQFQSIAQYVTAFMRFAIRYFGIDFQIRSAMNDENSELGSEGGPSGSQEKWRLNQDDCTQTWQ